MNIAKSQPAVLGRAGQAAIFHVRVRPRKLTAISTRRSDEPGIRVVRIDIEPFAMEPADLIAYLAGLNHLPLYDLCIGYPSDEFAEDNRELFSQEQLRAIGVFSEIVDALPPEPDQFWSDESLWGVEWQRVREQARAALAVLT